MSKLFDKWDLDEVKVEDLRGMAERIKPLF